VHYEDADDEITSTPLITVLGSESTLSGLNPLGEVSGGFILLEAQKIVDGLLIAPKDYEFHYRLKIGSHVLSVSPDSLLVEEEFDSGTNEVRHTVRRGRIGEIYKPFKAPVTCLAISASSDQCISCLVLALSSSVPGAYERLGLFTCGTNVIEVGRKRRIKLV
jgi:hypothetical protein